MNSVIDYLPTIFGAISILAATAIWIKSPKETLKGFFGKSQNSFKESVLLGFSAIAFSFGFTTLLGRHFPHPERPEYADFIQWMHNPVGLTVCLFLTLVFAPFTEELFFRGLLIDGFRKFLKCSAGVAIAGSAVLFALSHTTTQLLSLVLFAGCLGLLRVRSGTLRTTVLTHFLNNCIGMSIIYFDLARPNDWFASGIVVSAVIAFGVSKRERI